MNYEELKKACRNILDKIKDGAGVDEIVEDAARLPPSQQDTFFASASVKNQNEKDALLTALDTILSAHENKSTSGMPIDDYLDSLPDDIQRAAESFHNDLLKARASPMISE